MNNKLYDILAYLNRVGLPALSALVAGILALVGVEPATIATITGIFACVITFLGAILQGYKAEWEAKKEKENE